MRRKIRTFRGGAYCQMRFFFFFQENLEQNRYHVGPVCSKMLNTVLPWALLLIPILITRVRPSQLSYLHQRIWLKKKKCISQYELSRQVFPGALGTTDETLTLLLGVTVVRKKSFRHLASKLPRPGRGRGHLFKTLL